MSDDEELEKIVRKLKKALGEDWRLAKQILEEDHTDEEIREKLGELQVDMILQEGENISDYAA